VKVSPWRPVKETSLPSVLPLQAATASGGGPGGLSLPLAEDEPLDEVAATAVRQKLVQKASKMARSKGGNMAYSVMKNAASIEF